MARRVEDLRAWKFAKELERRVFELIASAPVSRDFDFCDQIRRSSRSAPRNITEGFGRFYPRDFARFLHVAVASLRETVDHLGTGLEVGYMSEVTHTELTKLADGAIGSCVRLIEYLDACQFRRPNQKRRKRSGEP